jgi:hypothetical protein
VRGIAWIALGFVLLGTTYVGTSGCGAILGIEELHESPDGGTSGPGGAGAATSATAGTSSSSGGSGAGGDAVTAGSGGSTSTGGSGGASLGDGGPATVQGTIIDFWRHKVPSIAVRVSSSAGAVMATTDANGQFTASNVVPPYDVSFRISTTGSGGTVVHVWLFKGLRRSNPTLQVYRGLPARSGTVNATISNLVFDSSTTAVAVAVGSADGAFEFQTSPPGTEYLSGAWSGPAMTSATGHALAWKHIPNGWPTDTTTGFIAYDTRAMGLTEAAGGSSVTFDLATESITSGSITGTVVSSGSERENDVYIHFTSGASIHLASLDVTTADFTYLVPTLPNASIAIAAQTGTISRPPFAVAHQDGLAAGQTGVRITIPVPATLIEPADGTKPLPANATFRWSGGSGVSVWHLSSVNFYEDMFIVTADKQAQLPAPADGGLALAAGQPYTWSVENHGNLATMDDATGSNGFLDSSSRDGQVVGPRRDSGSYTGSAERLVTP